VLAHEGEAFGVVQQAGEVEQAQCSHDGGNSSREPVGPTLPPSHQMPFTLATQAPKPITPEPNKSLTG